MRTLELLLVSAIGVVLVGGCRKGAAPEGSPSGPPPAAEAEAEAPAEASAADSGPEPAAEPAAVPAPTAHPQSTQIIVVRMGPPPDASGATSFTGIFRSGEEVRASVDASLLPPGAIVKVSWFDASDAPKGEEHKQVQGDSRWLTFTAPGSSSWSDGTYRVEFVVSTGGYANETFTIGQYTEQPTPIPG